MPVITSIKPQKAKNRVNVYVDGKFGFGLDLENFVKLGLKVEQQLSEEEIEEIVRKAEFQKTLDKLLRFAMTRPRSEKEVNDWFYRKKVPDSIQEELFKRLVRLELVDDEKFAKWWVEQRQAFRPKPKRILNNELRIKGIDREVINRVLNETTVDEIGVAKKELEKRMYKWKEMDKFTRKRKMGEFLARKGFNWDIIKRVVTIEDE